MSICFNSLQVVAPEKTTRLLLAKAFRCEEEPTALLDPQNFSFAPFIQDQVGQPSSIERIWTNWIEQTKRKRQRALLIEFESADAPPLIAINAMISWLQQQHLSFQLHYKYRRENEASESELKAQYPT